MQSQTMSPVLPENGFNLSNVSDLEAMADYESPYVSKSTIEMYGFGKEFRTYAGLPEDYPLRAVSQHGIVLLDKPEAHELQNGLPLMLMHSRRLQAEWKKLSKKRCQVIKSPFHTYRVRNKITQHANAAGSIFFVSHTTFWNKAKLDVNKLILQINNLPEAFKPVDICLHFVDIKKGLHHAFLNAGFTCYCAGNQYNEDFIKNFYSFVPKFKYVLTNHVGSYVFYAVDLNIPVSMVGESPEYEYEKTKFYEAKVSTSKDHTRMRLFEEILGQNLNTEISEELRRNCIAEMGITDGMEPDMLRRELMLAYKKYELKHFKKKVVSLIKNPTASLKKRYNRYIELKYRKTLRNKVKNKNFTIISANCFGGSIYEDLGLPYNTPTVGLFFYAPCYIHFLKHLEVYLSTPLEFIHKSKYEEANAYRAGKHDYYPIGILNDIEIHFLHYKSEIEARGKWDRRKVRINFDNLFIYMSDRDLCSTSLMREFDVLPFKNKLLFSAKKQNNIKSLYFLPAYEGADTIGDLYKNRWSYRKSFDVSKWLNGEM